MNVCRRGDDLVVDGCNLKGRYSFCFGNIRFLERNGVLLPSWLLDLAREKANPAPIAIEGYAFKTPPWDHQKRSSSGILTHKRFNLYNEPGTGKTKAVIDAIGWLFWKEQIKKALVVAPLSVLPTWKREWEAHASFGSLISAKTVPSLKKMIERWNDIPRSVLLLNYEKVSSLEKELRRACIDFIACDEINKVKSHRAQRTKALASVAKDVSYVVGMTGTPATRHLIDVFGQYLVVDPFWFGRKFFSFRHRYCVMGGWMNKEIVGYKNIEEIREFIDKSSITVLKRDAGLNLPPKVYEERSVEMSPDQRALYKKLKAQYLVEVGQTAIDVNSALTRITKLQEVAGGFVIGTEGDTLRVSNTKVETVLEILEELPPTTPVVIWCRFHEEIKMLTEAILDRRVFQLHGGMSADERERAESTFKSKASEGPVWIIQIQTGGLGLQIEYVSHCVIYSNTFEALYRLQLEDRFHRAGQVNPVTYYDLVTEDSVDRKILNVLKQRKSLNEWILERRGNLNDILKGTGE